MTISLKTNIPALAAQRHLQAASDRHAAALERVASGLRINRASDDPAGLMLASLMRMEKSIYTTAVRNVSDGVSYLTVADAGSASLKDILIRLQELATQSSNGAITDAQRVSLNQEAQGLVTEYNRIIDTTNYNGISVLQTAQLTVQAGSGRPGVIDVTFSGSYTTTTTITTGGGGTSVGDGTFQAATTVGSGFFRTTLRPEI